MDPKEYLRLKRLANRAAELLCDADFKEMLADLKNRAIREWAETSPQAVNLREIAYSDIQAVGRLEALMKGYGGALEVENRKLHLQGRKNG